VDPLHGLRSMGRRGTDPVEQLAEKTAERVIDLVVRNLDVNTLVQRDARAARLRFLDQDAPQNPR
jgi:hypothetical protein